MQKKKQTKQIKQIIIYTLLVLLVLLIVFAEDIIKLANKNKLALLENNPNEIAPVEPNPPHFVAGMIPIKWNGTNWIITSREDKDWYDYRSGKPAYVMLNDGYYRSEIEQGVTDDQLMANAVGNDAINVPNVENNNPTILMWIPRFAINNETNDIKYIQGIEKADENWTIPDIFTHKQESETLPDFLLTGIWFEKDVDTNYASKVTIMNTKDSIYGFIANTTAVSSDQPTQNIIENYIANTVGNDALVVPKMNDITNPNRVILHILKANNQDPMKAKASYNKDTGLIEVQVTYTQYGIEKILYENTSELKLEKNGRQVTGTSEGIDVKDGERTITIIDNNGNQKKIKVQVVSRIYATLYTDGTLAFGKTQNPLPEKTVRRAYGEVPTEGYWQGSGSIPWRKNSSEIKTATFVDEIYITSTASFFDYCQYLTKVENMHNLKGVTDMSHMFNKCDALTEIDVSNLDTSKVIDMNYMFCYCSSLTKLDVSKWDTSNVTNMNTMFYRCSSLTELDVSNWNTSKVTNMQDIFDECSTLTQLDVSNFDTSNVTNMYGMFYECSNLTQLDVSNFDTSKVTNMAYMFPYCRNLTQLDVSNFDTSNVTNMGYMFASCTGLTKLDLSSFDTSKVTNVNNIFNNCTSLAQISFGENWTKTVTLPTPSKTGHSCTAWYSNAEFTNKVANVGASYTPAVPITIYANLLPLTYATLYTDGTLAIAKSENPLPEKTISRKFGEVPAEGYSGNIPWIDNSGIKTVNIVDEIQLKSAYSLFYNCKELTKVEGINNLKGVTNMYNMFYNCTNLTEIDVSKLDTSKVTNMDYMFSGCSSLTKLDVSNFDTSKVTDMPGMFRDCSSLTELDVSNWNTSNVKRMYGIFNGCSSLTALNLTNWDTSNVTDMSNLFNNCSTLTELDLRNFNTENVTDMTCMFDQCKKITKLNISNWNTSKVTDMSAMFRNCSSLTTLDLSQLDTSNVTRMYGMFQRCTGLTELDLSNFDTRKARSMERMFLSCTNLQTIYVGENWITDNVTTTEMFYYCGTDTVTRR